MKQTEVTKEIKSATSTRRCTCRQDFQDQRYGAGQRIHNHTKSGKWRCTGCGNVKD